MFFENTSEITEIAKRTGCAIFVIPDEVDFTIKNALVLAPEEKTVITIEQVRTMVAGLGLKQTTDRFVIIRPAEKMGLDAANAFLKNLEEPGDKIHYVLITSKPSLLLPTVLSRAQIYFLKTEPAIMLGVAADEKIKNLAKKMMVAKPGDLPAIAEEICKKKEGTRNYALSILGTAIEMLYKSYFMTGKEVFVKKLPSFLKAYENIERNGHIKLHLVADLI
jgi:DNA polymerase III delta prime subunit